jgi:hypothetical protein
MIVVTGPCVYDTQPTRAVVNGVVMDGGVGSRTRPCDPPSKLERVPAQRTTFQLLFFNFRTAKISEDRACMPCRTYQKLHEVLASFTPQVTYRSVLFVTLCTDQN